MPITRCGLLVLLSLIFMRWMLCLTKRSHNRLALLDQPGVLPPLKLASVNYEV